MRKADYGACTDLMMLPQTYLPGIVSPLAALPKSGQIWLLKVALFTFILDLVTFERISLRRFWRDPSPKTGTFVLLFRQNQ